MSLRAFVDAAIRMREAAKKVVSETPPQSQQRLDRLIQCIEPNWLHGTHAAAMQQAMRTPAFQSIETKANTLMKESEPFLSAVCNARSDNWFWVAKALDEAIAGITPYVPICEKSYEALPPTTALHLADRLAWLANRMERHPSGDTYIFACEVCDLAKQLQSDSQRPAGSDAVLSDVIALTDAILLHRVPTSPTSDTIGKVRQLAKAMGLLQETAPIEANPGENMSTNNDNLYSRVSAYVRTHQEDFRAAGHWLDEEFSYEACRRKDAVSQAAARRDLPKGSTPQPAKVSRNELAPLARLERALRDLRTRYYRKDGTFDSESAMAMDISEAKQVLMLTWLLFDSDAHAITPAICEFAQLPWLVYAKVAGEPDCRTKEQKQQEVSSRLTEYPNQGRQKYAGKLTHEIWGTQTAIAWEKVRTVAVTALAVSGPSAGGKAQTAEDLPVGDDAIGVSEFARLMKVNKGVVSKAAKKGMIEHTLNPVTGEIMSLNRKSAESWLNGHRLRQESRNRKSMGESNARVQRLMRTKGGFKD